MNDSLDQRLFAYREDLADEALKGRVQAGKFVRGDMKMIHVPCADIRPQPDETVGIDTQALYGDHVRVFDNKEGWAWVQSARDNYVGYVPSDALSNVGVAASHRVSVPRTFIYAEPDMKRPAIKTLSLGSTLMIDGSAETRGTHYAKTSDGHYVIAHHVSPIEDVADDYVSAAEQLLHTPYLWGGASAFGIDCSGLVQLSMLMAGQKVQRDSDMQEQTTGHELGFAAMDGGLQRGDLVFWKGHVGIMRSPTELIHANGHTMSVATELLEDAIERIGYLYGFPRTLRRP